MSKTHNAGIVTAYGAAVRGGYTGTYEDFCRQQAQYAENAQTVEQAKNTAVSAANTATTKAGEAATATTAAQTAKTQTEQTASQALTDISTARSGAISAVQTEGQKQTANARAQAQAAATSANTASTKASEASASATSAGQSATNAAASATNAASSASAAQAVLESIPEEYSNLSEDVDKLKADLADVTNHAVKSAEQLISDKRTVDKAPYKYRASASGKSDRAYDMIVGGTVCFNQLCNGTSVDTVSGRKYLTKIGGIWSIVTSAGSAITGLTSDTDMVTDLTAMFGIIIANYIYSLERATAGAGVALFRAMFNKEYYPYNAGELVSIEGLSAHATVGFNQWDEKYEVYGTSQIRSKNKIPVLPGVTYYAKTPSVGISLFFKAQINDTDNVGAISVTNNTFTVPANAHYAVIYTNTGHGAVYKNDICINISSDKNGRYEPYHKNVYPLDSTLTLRGIPVLNDGKIEFDGDRYLPDGTVERRYGIVDLGTLSWVYSASPNDGFYCDDIGAKIPQTTAQKFVGICPIYEIHSYNEVFAKTYDKSIAVRTNGGLRIYDSAYTDATAFKSAISGVMLVYELATPTTEEATPYQHLQQCDPSGTEEYISETICPVGHITEYPDNLRAKLDGLPWDLSMIAPVETAYTATRNYTVNQLLIVDNTLYKVTANIANGGTITPNSNVTATTLSEVIASLS